MYDQGTLRWEVVSNRWLKKTKLSEKEEQKLLNMGFRIETVQDNDGILRKTNYIQEISDISEEKLKEIAKKTIQIFTQIYCVPEKNKLKFKLP